MVNIHLVKWYHYEEQYGCNRCAFIQTYSNLENRRVKCREFLTPAIRVLKQLFPPIKTCTLLNLPKYINSNSLCITFMSISLTL